MTGMTPAPYTFARVDMSHRYVVFYLEAGRARGKRKWDAEWWRRFVRIKCLLTVVAKRRCIGSLQTNSGTQCTSTYCSPLNMSLGDDLVGPVRENTFHVVFWDRRKVGSEECRGDLNRIDILTSANISPTLCINPSPPCNTPRPHQTLRRGPPAIDVFVSTEVIRTVPGPYKYLHGPTTLIGLTKSKRERERGPSADALDPRAGRLRALPGYHTRRIHAWSEPNQWRYPPPSSDRSQLRD